ncbi:MULTISPECIES: imidazoleglycerol-phosphate dehydratase HisB [Desulfosediminicola]|uniref:imidazoleglycerol-phosphate dehydratase HisB n=1 Tax=Desulfosediminicola TaxID=2886823 RepID=UPI001C3C4D75|nr:imidazoleglycerol-phosphate dehydratase HisB [Desulfosediminicola ganghwensis]
MSDEMITTRQASIARKTAETDIQLDLELDGKGECTIDSGVPFLDHMLTLFTVHGFFNMRLDADGDTEVDDHHTVEDIGICLGQVFAKALGNKSGIQRYGSCYLPMDETLVRVVVDLSNRPFLHYNAPVSDPKVGTFDTCLAKEFARAFSLHAGITLHVDLLHGENAHHIIEAVFKALGRAMNDATRPLASGIVMSSKGCL